MTEQGKNKPTLKAKPRIYSLDENDELVVTQKSEDKEASQKSSETQATSNISKKQEKEPTNRSPSQKRKINTPEETTIDSPSKVQKTGSPTNAWTSGKNLGIEASKKVTTTKKAQPQEQRYIRVRMQFMGEGAKEVTYQEQLRKVIYKTMNCVKEIDPSASLLPWSDKNTMKSINGNEVKLLTKSILEKYIDISTKLVNKFTHGKIYYRNGLRIKTNLDVSTFVDIWSNKKYNVDNESPFKKWKSIKPAEMQRYEEGHAIGYFVGSVDRGDYSTIDKALREEFGNSVEASFQLIDQKGVSQKIWQHARERAEKRYENIYSKEHKREKFKYSPSGLVVYVGVKDQVKMIRRKICQKYGSIKNNQWPKMQDGSRMRFMPIIQGTIQNKKVYDNMYNHLLTQSVSKTYDSRLDLNLWDIHDPKPYFDDQSLEQVIHEMESENKPGIPLFKHITKKW